MKYLLNKIKCWFNGHDWTCAAKKGVAPTVEQSNGGMVGFKDYAQMYCDRCGKISKLNNRL